MKCAGAVLVSLLVASRLVVTQSSLLATAQSTDFKVILLGVVSGPQSLAEGTGISTLVIAGPEQLLFDVGRGAPSALPRHGIQPASVTKVFLTHLHSDHVISLPEIYLFPWASQGRGKPLQVWGPAGTRSMLEHLRNAFAFDIHVRRDLDERFSAAGIEVNATDITEGIVHRAGEVVVSAFLVDHGPVAPAFGYRVTYKGRSVVLSGDTAFSENLIRHAQRADLLLHEISIPKNDPSLAGPDDEILPNGQTRRQRRTIIAHHTDPSEVARVFTLTKPKLGVITHYRGRVPSIVDGLATGYAGPVEFGEDGMTIEVGDKVVVSRFKVR